MDGRVDGVGGWMGKRMIRENSREDESKDGWGRKWVDRWQNG